MKRKRKPLDRLDGERVRELALMPGWKIVEKRYRQQIEKAVQSLIESTDPIESANLRGQIAAYRTAILIPSIIDKESTKEASHELRNRPEED